TREEISPVLEQAYRMIEQAAINKRFLRNEGKLSSGVLADLVPDDVIRSATPGSVKQAMVVHAPLVVDFEPE
ncbi:hypothetical protein ZWY2020_048124, partial [Hordeum vulgare]